jgi:hypothetical protein
MKRKNHKSYLLWHNLNIYHECDDLSSLKKQSLAGHTCRLLMVVGTYFKVRLKKGLEHLTKYRIPVFTGQGA